MSYKRVRVTDQRTGTVEEFSIRISNQGFREWLLDRDNLRKEGKPDRPPDMDTATMRLWLAHPGEEKMPFFAKAPTTPRQFNGCYMVAWSSAMLSVYTCEGGGYIVRLESDTPYVPRMVRAVPDNEYTWDEIEALLARVNETTDADGNSLWSRVADVTTHADVEQMELEAELAQADIARGFPSPLPGSKLIQ